MAITDVPAFAHLTDADIESLAVELDMRSLGRPAHLEVHEHVALSIR